MWFPHFFLNSRTPNLYFDHLNNILKFDTSAFRCFSESLVDDCRTTRALSSGISIVLLVVPGDSGNLFKILTYHL